VRMTKKREREARKRLPMIALLMAILMVVAACGTDGTTDTTAGGSESPDTTAGGSGSSDTTAGGSSGDDTADGEPIVITVAQGVDTESGDAGNLNATPSVNFGMAVYDRLVDRAPDGSFVPGLATDWASIDDRTWEFNLREDAVFHDGTPVTADDVVFTFERLFTGDYGASNNIVPISGVEKVDDFTVRLTTEEPYAALLARTVFAHIAPKHYVEQVGDEEFALNPIGSGPFKFVEWSRDERLVVEAFDDYWGGRPVADQIVFRPISENSTRVAALRTGEVDIIVNVPPDVVPEVEGDDCCVMAPVPSVRVMFVGMNAFTPPLDDPRVRQALNYAVDKKTLMETILSGMAYDHDGKSLLFGPSNFGYKNPGDIDDYEYDPEKARQLLAEAGYPDGITLKFEGPRGRYMQDAELTEAIAGMLAEAGIQTELTISEWGTFWPKTVGGEQEHLWFLGLGNSILDAEYYYNLYLSSEGRGYYHSPEIDELIRATGTIMDPDEREEALHQLHKKLVEEEAPWIFLWDQADLYARGADIVGWEPRSDERLDLRTVTRQP
jgi:peptide/nickel transport system substrate-binding protein